MSLFQPSHRPPIKDRPVYLKRLFSIIRLDHILHEQALQDPVK